LIVESQPRSLSAVEDVEEADGEADGATVVARVVVVVVPECAFTVRNQGTSNESAQHVLVVALGVVEAEAVHLLMQNPPERWPLRADGCQH
jgi:hypothetical protein